MKINFAIRNLFDIFTVRKNKSSLRSSSAISSGKKYKGKNHAFIQSSSTRYAICAA
jgi:hypothetical protein